MKKLLLFLLLANTTTANAQEKNDTLTILKPQKVRIITGDSIQKIKVYGRENDSRYTYENTIQLVDSNYVSSVDINKDKWNFDFMRKHSKDTGYPLERKILHTYLGFGLCQGVGANYNGSISMGSSWEISWTIFDCEKFGYGKRSGYSYGFGLNWRNYRIDNSSRFVKLDDGKLTQQNLPEGYENDFSRIKVFSLNIPVMYRYRGDKVSFGLGPVFNFNTYASIKNRYRDADGKKHKELYKHIHQRPVTVDIMASVKFINWVGIYVKYSPMTLFSSTYGDDINFHPLSIGIIL